MEKNYTNDIKYKYSKLQEKYENLEGWHESVLQESLKFENELEIYKKENDQLKQQLEDTLSQNKRVLYKLELIVKDNQDLQKQLAEKEKEVEVYKQAQKKAIHFYSDEFVEKDKELKELRYKVSKADQDKISFAVEQLEKVRKYLKHKGNVKQIEAPIQLFKERTDYLSYFEIPESDFNRIFDNQIEQLKKEMK